MTEPFFWLGQDHPDLPVVLTVPHSGEELPPEADWLRGLSRELLLSDVDRFVHELYSPAVSALKLPLLATRIHRYAADLNRYPDDVDQDSVLGASEPSGKYPQGFHWVVSTSGERILKTPISQARHEELVRRYHDRFHSELAARLQGLRGARRVFHLDCHSMPSRGTGAHRDGGEKRAEVVVSDFQGKSASAGFKDLVLGAFELQGFQVAYNWPYFGGRITQRYGHPEQGHETIQIELNRALYLDEKSCGRNAGFAALQSRLQAALAMILSGLSRS